MIVKIKRVMVKMSHVFQSLRQKLLMPSESILRYQYNEKLGTASVIGSSEPISGGLIIPETIHYQHQDYIVTEIGIKAFTNQHITHIAFSKKLLKINCRAFMNNDLRHVVLPENLTYVGAMAFKNNNILSLTLNHELLTIENMAFMNNKLLDVVFDYNLLQIGASAFANNNLHEVALPKNVSLVGRDAFLNNYISRYDFNDDLKTDMLKAGINFE